MPLGSAVCWHAGLRDLTATAPGGGAAGCVEPPSWPVGWWGGGSEVPPLALAGVLAFVAGGVVMNTNKEELSEQRESRLGPFVMGAGGCALLLLLLQ